MIDLKNQTVELLGKSEKIEKWVVVFVTLQGAFETIEEAHKSCETTGQDPNTIFPLPCAMGASIYELCLKQTMLLPDQTKG